MFGDRCSRMRLAAPTTMASSVAQPPQCADAAHHRRPTAGAKSRRAVHLKVEKLIFGRISANSASTPQVSEGRSRAQMRRESGAPFLGRRG
jgi:hypothetical protein